LHGNGNTGVRGRFGIAVAALAAFVALLAVPSAQASNVAYSSTFGTTSEGWVAVDNGKAKDMTWEASGGHPNGYITTQFPSGIGGVQSGRNPAGGSTWKAGNAAGDYGGSLAVDLRVHFDGSSDDPDLAIGLFSANATTRACQDFGAPPSSWTTYTVKLTRHNLVDCSSNLPLTGAQVTAALAGFTSMYVAAVNDDGVSETVDVDNARLSGPKTAGTAPTGNIQRWLTLTHTAQKLTGTLLSFDDFSCAGKVNVAIFEKGRKHKIATVKSRGQVKDRERATFSLELKPDAKGTYYASIAKATSKLDGNSCIATKSSPVKIR
jgi:hypothetical protein